jgi:hypothetical protein
VLAGPEEAADADADAGCGENVIAEEVENLSTRSLLVDGQPLDTAGPGNRIHTGLLHTGIPSGLPYGPEHRFGLP